MTDQRLWQDESRLRQMYVEREMSTYDIAEEMECSRVTVSNWLSKFGIDIRGRQPDSCALEDESLSRELYVEQGRSLSGVTEEVGTTVWKVRYWLDRHGIETREPGGSGFAVPELTDADWLRERYLEQGATTVEIADELGCTARTVNAWMHKHDIDCPWKLPETAQNKLSNPDWLRWAYEVRDRHVEDIADELRCSTGYLYEQLGRHDITGFDMVGEDHPMWNGGEYAYGEGWSEGTREAIRDRDDRECRLCGMSSDEHHEKHGMKLHVHHIVKARNVERSERRNDHENLITLCATCHVIAEETAPELPEGIDE